MRGDLSAPTGCRACRAPIRFITTTAGKHMPVESSPTEGWLRPANGPGVVVVVDLTGKTHRGRPCSPAEPGARLIQGYTPHWGNCTGAVHFRPRAKATP